MNLEPLTVCPVCGHVTHTATLCHTCALIAKGKASS